MRQDALPQLRHRLGRPRDGLLDVCCHRCGAWIGMRLTNTPCRMIGSTIQPQRCGLAVASSFKQPCAPAAGDLPLMWIRDSAVQINVLLPRIRKRPALRRPIEGAIRAQAFYILQVSRAAGFGCMTSAQRLCWVNSTVHLMRCAECMLSPHFSCHSGPLCKRL